MLKFTGKEKRYTVSPAEKKTIKTKLIPLIKKEMATDHELFGEATVGDFFDTFIINMEDFYKQHCFTVGSITKNFQKIYHTVHLRLHGKTMNGHSSKRMNGNVLIGRDYSETKDYTVNHD
jgi:hypothetical protein